MVDISILGCCWHLLQQKQLYQEHCPALTTTICATLIQTISSQEHSFQLVCVNDYLEILF